MKQDFDGFGVSSQDDKLCDASVKSFGSFVCTLLQLLVLRSLLNEVENLIRESSVRDRPSLPFLLIGHVDMHESLQASRRK